MNKTPTSATNLSHAFNALNSFFPAQNNQFYSRHITDTVLWDFSRIDTSARLEERR